MKKLSNYLIFSLALLSTPSFAKSRITNDIGPTLQSILDRDQIKGACRRYWKNKNAKEEILCGKSIFFNLEIATDMGIPQQMLDQLKRSFPNEFEKIGLYDDPDNPNQKIGLVKVKSLHPMQAKDLLSFKGVRQISCAGCHVGQMPDGRWSVGYPNYRFNAGVLNTLFTFSLWLADKRKNDTSVWEPELIKKFKDMEKVVLKNPLQNWLLLSSRLASNTNLSGPFYKFIKQDPPSIGDQKSYLFSRPGVYNAASPIVSFGKREFYTTPPQIWGMRHKDSLDEAYLGTITSVNNLEAFIKHAYVYTSLTSKFSSDNYVRPLARYMRSLKTPKYLGEIDQEKAQKGKQFFQYQCMTCHDGLNGASLNRYPVEVVGSPQAIDSIFLDYTQPTKQSKQLLQALQKAYSFEPITYGIKARRLNGIWSKRRLMTNGSIEDLDHLFCLNGKKRNKVFRRAQSELPHHDLCDLNFDEKENLKHFLLSY